MGLLDWIRGRLGKPKPKPHLPQVAYTMAYYILSDYCLNHRDRLLAMCQGPPRVANVFYYIMACQALKMEPVSEDGLRFQWRPGKLDDGREYLVMEYPAPPDIGLEAAVLE